MKLYEVSGTADYEVIKSTNSLFTTRSTIGERAIIFSAVEDEQGSWEIEFSEKGTQGRTYKQTHSGQPFKVLTMVLSSLKEFVSRYHPDALKFTADSYQRGQIYGALLLKALPNWQLHYRQDHDRHFFSASP